MKSCRKALNTLGLFTAFPKMTHKYTFLKLSKYLSYKIVQFYGAVI